MGENIDIEKNEEGGGRTKRLMKHYPTVLHSLLQRSTRSTYTPLPNSIEQIKRNQTALSSATQLHKQIIDNQPIAIQFKTNLLFQINRVIRHIKDLMTSCHVLLRSGGMGIGVAATSVQ